MPVTGSEALVAQLAREGVGHVFGVPGVQLDHAVDALARARNRITYVTTRHEQACAYMADGYARATGGVGTMMVVPGPGLLNAMAGLATAYACSSPVLCIVGQIPSRFIGRGVGILHEVPEQSRLLDSVTKWHRLARSADEVAPLIRQAFVELRSGRPRPVAIEIPPDVLAATTEIAEVAPPAGDFVTAGPDPAAVAEAARLLAAARRPVLFVGSGALGASAELRRVAEALGAPVIVTRSGRGVLSDRHDLALTRLSGRQVLPEADVVLVVGSRFVTFAGTQVKLAPGAKLIMVDADPATLGEPRQPDLAILGDARLFLEALAERLAPGGANDWGDAAARARVWAAEQLAPIEPQMSYLRAIRAALPDDGILVSDLTQVAYPVRIGFPFYAPRTNITSGYQGTLGFGFPTALGAKVGDPGRAVVAVCGDGGFGWGLPELATARQFGIGAVTVLFNDGAYGNVLRTQQDDFGGRVHGTRLRNPDFVALARSFDVDAERVDSPAALEAALRAALARGEPALIEVPIGDVPSPWHLLG